MSRRLEDDVLAVVLKALCDWLPVTHLHSLSASEPQLAVLQPH